MNNTVVIIKVYVTRDEKRRIVQAARKCHLPVSRYSRGLLLGHMPVCHADIRQMESILRVSADLGRLGGLLKMLLTNDERLQDMGREMGLVTIDGILVDIRVTQANLREISEHVRRQIKRS